MEDYEASTTVDAPAEELFEYLSKVENLPQYFDRMTSVHNLPGDEVEVEARVEPGDAGSSSSDGSSESDGERTVGGDAWFRIDADTMTLSWGSQGPHDYHGQLSVTPSGEAASTVTVTLHTTHQAEGIEDGIEQTLANIQRIAGSSGELNPGAGTA
jgi:polyketide cyclase/dehydrase/lipid transport protein